MKKQWLAMGVNASGSMHASAISSWKDAKEDAIKYATEMLTAGQPTRVDKYYIVEVTDIVTYEKPPIVVRPAIREEDPVDPAKLDEDLLVLIERKKTTSNEPY